MSSRPSFSDKRASDEAWVFSLVCGDRRPASLVRGTGTGVTSFEFDNFFELLPVCSEGSTISAITECTITHPPMEAEISFSLLLDLLGVLSTSSLPSFSPSSSSSFPSSSSSFSLPSSSFSSSGSSLVGGVWYCASLSDNGEGFCAGNSTDFRVRNFFSASLKSANESLSLMMNSS